MTKPPKLSIPIARLKTNVNRMFIWWQVPFKTVLEQGFAYVDWRHWPWQEHELQDHPRVHSLWSFPLSNNIIYASRVFNLDRTLWHNETACKWLSIFGKKIVHKKLITIFMVIQDITTCFIPPPENEISPWFQCLFTHYSRFVIFSSRKEMNEFSLFELAPFSTEQL